MKLEQILVILGLYWHAAVEASVEEDALNDHNKYREMHGVPPLTMSSNLNWMASNYAYYLAQNRVLVHSNSKGAYGENLCARGQKAKKCTDSWYAEIRNYDFFEPVFKIDSGHFTQMIWAATKEMGYGEALGPDGNIYAVALYKPAGNIVHKFHKNVPSLVSNKNEPDTGDSNRSKSGGISLSMNAILILICFGLSKLTY